MKYTIYDKKVKGPIFSFLNKYYERVFSSPKRTVLYTGGLLSILLMIFFSIILFAFKTFYNNWTDDILQYYPFMVDFIENIKAGDWSLFNYTNYLGASVFADAYYIPIDIFTGITFLLSLVMNTEIAMSIVELLKMVLGTMALCTFLALKGSKPKHIHLIGLLYFSSSGLTNFCAFPAFASLNFYLPFSLIIAHYFMKGKWYLVPVFSFAIVLYNFYLAYTVFAFMVFSIIFMLILEKRKWYRVILDTVSYILLILLGLFMGMAMFMPSYYYIMHSTSRNVSEEGSIEYLLKMFASYFEYLATMFKCLFNLFANLLKDSTNIITNPRIVYDSFIPLNVLDNEMTRKGYLFNVEEYFRIMNNTFMPSASASFYGYQESYLIEHISLYVTSAGLVFASYVWFMKDYKSKVYKIMLIFIMLLMSVPFFSYILSANLTVLYTRWMNIIPIPLLLIAGHVLREKDTFELKSKNLVVIGFILAYFATMSSYHHLYKLSGFAESYNWGEELVSFERLLFFGAIFLLALIASLLVSITLIKKTKIKKVLSSITVVSFLALLAGLIYKLYKAYKSLPANVFSTTMNGTRLYSVDIQMMSEFMTLLTVGFVIVFIYAIVNKNKKVLITICAMEFIISACFSFGVSAVYHGKETTFKNTYALDDFLKENMDERDIYRVYVDSSIPDIQDYNRARLLPTGTNSKIFHSFVNMSTDNLVYYLFDIMDEGQANKSALDTYSAYLNILLGYKYVAASSSVSLEQYGESLFTLKASTADYNLFEFKYYEEFLALDSYVEEEDYLNIKGNLTKNGKYRFLLNYGIVEESYLDFVKDKVNNSSLEDYSDDDSTTKESTSLQRQTLNANNRLGPVILTNDLNEEGLYYKYKFEGVDAISTKSYAINIFSFSSRSEELLENHQIFVEFSDGSISYDIKAEKTNGSTFHIPIYRNEDGTANYIKYLYVKAMSSTAGSSALLEYSVEAIFPEVGSIQNYENGQTGLNYPGLTPYVRFPIKDDISSGTVSLSNTNSSISLKDIIYEFVNEDGSSSFKPGPVEMTIEKPIKNIYVNKYTTGLYNLNTTTSIKCTYFDYLVDESYSDTLTDKDVTTKNSYLTISYKDNKPQEGYKIIVIPVAYSEEWKLISGSGELIKINGGFIGVVVPSSLSSNTITLRFVPEGFSDGILISIVSIMFYLSLLFNYILNKKRLKKEYL